MAFTVNIEISREFTVGASPKKTFTLLADVPESVSHFPKVDQLVDLGDEVYRWEMEKLGLGAYTLQVVYACKYANNAKEKWVQWEPVEGEGNGLIEGFWNLEKVKEGGTHVEFFTSGVLTLSLPALAKFVISPLVVAEFNGLVDKYIKNLSETLQE